MPNDVVRLTKTIDGVTYPVLVEYAERDTAGHIISEHYATYDDVNNKQGTLSATQMSAVNSSITLDKVNKYEAYAMEKQDLLISGTNIKSINGVSILGSGNMEIDIDKSNLVDLTTSQIISSKKTFMIAPDSVAPTESSNLANKEYVDAEVAKKQDTLVSGTSLKTINGETLLGAGDIPLNVDTSSLVNLTGEQTISGHKTFSIIPEITVEAATPTISTQLTTKAYVDALIARKQDTLISGLTIKTINDESILGEGNIIITGGSGGDGEYYTNMVDTTSTQTISGKKVFSTVPESVTPTEDNQLTIKSYVDAADATKQDLLVSGVNIKTINGISVVGTGNIAAITDSSNFVTLNSVQRITGTKSFYGNLGATTTIFCDTISLRDYSNDYYMTLTPGSLTTSGVLDNGNGYSYRGYINFAADSLTFYHMGGSVQEAVYGYLVSQNATADNNDNLVKYGYLAANYLPTSSMSTLYAALSGATFVGDVTLSRDPVSDMQAATKKYVDSVISDYKVTFTSSQQAALDSKITSEKVTAYDAYNTRITSLEGTVQGLSGAMHFIGTSETDPLGDSGATIEGVESYSDGDVCLYSGREYIYAGGIWQSFGDEGSYLTITDAVANYVPNTRTINGHDLKNDFDLVASDISGVATTSDITSITTLINGKQATLVSGTNIKTINEQSLLGEGNITLNLDTSNLVDITSAQTISGAKTFATALTVRDSADDSYYTTVNIGKIYSTGISGNYAYEGQIDFSGERLWLYQKGGSGQIVNTGYLVSNDSISTNSDNIVKYGYLSSNYSTSSTIAGAYAALAGATFTGDVTLYRDPVENMHAATKKYVDEAIENYKVTFTDAQQSALDSTITSTKVETFEGYNSRIETLEGTIKGLTGAMHFIGTSTTDPTGSSGPTITNKTSYASGDVCLYDGKEYIYDGTSWQSFGDEGSYLTIEDAASTYALNTRTINGHDLKSDFNIVASEIEGAATTSDISGLQTQIDSKQATLESGTNIKTINNESILGSGNLEVEGTFKNDVIATVDVGVHTVDTSIGYQTLALKGLTLDEAFKYLFQQAKAPTITNPSISSFSLSVGSSYEIGTKITPSYTIIFNQGAYSYGPSDTGVTASYIVMGGSEIFDTSTGTFSEMQLTANTTFTARVSWTKGVTPRNNLGEEASGYEIAAGSATATQTVTVWRARFYGYFSGDNALSDITNIDSTVLSKLNRKSSIPTTISTTKMQQIMFLVPVSDGVTAISAIDKSTNAPITITMAKDASNNALTYSIGGQNDYEPIAYNLFYSDNAAAQSGTTSWTITISKS